MNKQEIEGIKIGDIIYKITDVGIIPCYISKIDNHSAYYTYITFTDGTRISVSPSANGGNRKIYFTTKEEAENYLLNQEKLKQKKKKLYEYECKLNKELGIETFLIKY